MEKFKLLGIRPRKGCHRKLVKNLQIGELYKFFSDTKYYDKNLEEIGQHGDVHSMEFNTSVPRNLYAISTEKGARQISIDISAIAGKNGTGKSSLVELFCAAIFVFSVKKNLITPSRSELENDLKYWEDEMKTLNKLGRDLAKTKIKYQREFDKAIDDLRSSAESKPIFNKVNFADAELAITEQLRREKYLAKKIDEAQVRIQENRKKIDEYRKMGERVKVDLFYQIGNDFYQLSVDPELKEGVSLFRIPNKAKNSGIEEIVKIDALSLSKAFFYTITVNYSHYSLNSRYLGDWVKLLFHKNDGYRTPVVITPMRTDGNFDINTEADFARTRLLNNLLISQLYQPSSRTGVQITNSQNISEVYFTLDKQKIARIPQKVFVINGKLDGDDRAVDMVDHFLQLVFEQDKYTNPYSVDFPLRNIILNYISKKIDSIAENYTEFNPGYQWGKDSDYKSQNDEFLRKVINDKTHVTYKLKQSVNFLRYNIDTEGKNNFSFNKKDLKGNKVVRFNFSFPELLRSMRIADRSAIITQQPPSIFTVDFKLTNRRGSSSWFSALSSGEQQFIHTVQSILYHINNIQSAHAGNDRIKYKAVNVILDEIELYFHPDFQRRFISALLNAFENMHLHYGDEIKAINILFLTHSPFILSDIPAENILRLKLKPKTGKSLPIKEEFKTFAANIHELLANSFFIDGTLMGKFAEDRINALIEKIKKNEGSLTKEENQLLNMIGDTFLKSSIVRFKNLKENDKNRI